MGGGSGKHRESYVVCVPSAEDSPHLLLSTNTDS